MLKNKRNSKNPDRNRPNDLTCDELSLQPWFLPNRIQHAIRVLVPYNFRHKMRHYFDDYGCMICGDYKAYAANAMCLNCHNRIRRRMLASAHRRAKSEFQQRIEIDMLRQATIAKRLLGRFSPMHRLSSERHRLDTARSQNPVLEALGPRTAVR